MIAWSLPSVVKHKSTPWKNILLFIIPFKCGILARKVLLSSLETMIKQYLEEAKLEKQNKQLIVENFNFVRKP